MLRHRLTLGLALGTGLFTSIFAYNAMNDGAIEKTVSESMHEYNFQSVAVASTALPWGTVFSEEMVKVVDYPDGVGCGHQTGRRRNSNCSPRIV